MDTQVDSVQTVDLGLSVEDLNKLNEAYTGTMTACEGGSEGAYG